MFEFIGVVVVIVIILALLNSDVHFSIKIDGREIVKYESKTAEDEENAEKDKKDLN